MALVVGFVAAAPVVFLGSVSTAAVARQLAPLCRGRLVDPGIESGGSQGANAYKVDEAALARIAGEVGGFTPPVASAIGGRQPNLQPMQASAGGASTAVQLGTRTGWEQQVPGGAAAGDDRIWLPDTVAGTLGIGAGDQVTLTGSAGAVTLEVGGVIADPVSDETGFWCPLGPQLGSNVFFSPTVAPAPMAAVSPATFDEVIAATGGRVEWRRWEVPFAVAPATLAEARADVAAQDELERRVVAEGAVVRRTPGNLPPGQAPPLPENPLSNSSRLRYATARAGAVQDAVQATITPMALVSAAVALGLVAGVGVVWVDRRRAQVRLLWARGVAPGWIAVKALLEVLLPVVAGVALGWGLALVVGTRFGPSSVLEAGTAGRAALAVAVAGVLALLTMLATVAVRSRGGVAATPVRRRLAWFPWEVPVLVAAWWSLARLRVAGGPVVEGDRLPPVDTLALLFPLLLLVGVAGLAVRLLGLALRSSRRVGRRWPTAAYLAVRRLAAEGRTVVVLTALLALSAGVVTYGAGLVRSTQATAAAKAGVRLGADVVARVGTVAEVPAPLAGRATFVLRDDDLEYAGQPVDLVGVDPATFADAAFWDESFADRSLGDLLAALDGPDGSPAPAILVGGQAPASGQLVLGRSTVAPVDVRVVADARVWPGLRQDRTLLVVAEDDLGDIAARVPVQLWATGVSEAELRQVLLEAGLPALYVVSQQRFTDTSSFLPTVWTFGFVQALGGVVGLLALVGLVAYAEARQRARAVGYAMARRMGLTPGGNRRALLVELGVLATVAVVVGVAAGWVAVRSVNRLLDAQVERPPEALLRVPWDALGALVLAAVVAVVAVAFLAQRAAGRADPAEVLRAEV